VGDVSFRVGASLTGGGMGSLLLLGRGMDRVAKRGHQSGRRRGQWMLT
jgi:hypothetical protein